MNLKLNYVEYYRVSTEDHQGKEGLGIKSQETFVKDFIVRNGGDSLGSFTDVFTGKSNARENLLEAIKLCMDTGATLISYDLRRLSRGGLGIMHLLESNNVRYMSAISPYDNNFSKTIKFAVAKEEVEAISRNTKKALQKIKDTIALEGSYTTKRGRVITKLGCPNPISQKAIENSIKVRSKRAINNPNNLIAGAFIVKVMSNPNATIKDVTDSLNKAGFKTSRNNNFSQMQTKRLYERYKNLDIV